MSTLLSRARFFALTLATGLALVLGFAGPVSADTRVGAVFSTAQSDWQSFLRFYNTGSAAGSAVVVVQDFNSGQTLGQWISPPIPAGAEQQYDIKTLETAIGITNKPYYYSISVQTPFVGYFQHVLWRAADGTLTNLSTCDVGVTAASTTLVGVHSSLLNYGYPSTIVVNNTGTQASAVALGIYDARDGVKLGTYTTTAIPVGGAQTIAVANIESGIGRAPTPSMYHYVIKDENPSPFTGFFQNLVNNLQSGVTTDMTTECALNGAPVTGSSMPIRIGAVFSTAQLSSRSYLRVFNTGASPATVAVNLRDQVSGQSYGTWVSPFVNPGAEQQFGIDIIENSVLGGASKPPYYTISVQSNMQGFIQHVLWRVTDGTLTNLSTCSSGVTADKTRLTGVHSSLLGNAYPSQIYVNNLGAANSATLGIYDARDGTLRGTYTTPSIHSNGQFTAAASSLEVAIGRSPGDSAMYHYVVKIENPFIGFMEHLVNNLQARVLTDMTTACAMN